MALAGILQEDVELLAAAFTPQLQRLQTTSMPSWSR